MSFLYRFRRPLQNGPSQRDELRACVRGSRSGCVVAFQKIVDAYADLVFEYLHLCGMGRRKVIQAEAEKTFLFLWTQMPLTKRVSDVERLLWLQLSKVPCCEQSPKPSSGPLPSWWNQLIKLSPEERFLFVAREMEGWPIHWLSLATRLSPEQLEEKLYQVRRTLVANQLPAPDPQLEKEWRALSLNWDRKRDLRTTRAIDKSTAANADVRAFKTTWLERRCDWIEVRQDFRLSSQGKSLFLHQLTTRVATQERHRPPLRTRLLNTIHFSALPDGDRA